MRLKKIARVPNRNRSTGLTTLGRAARFSSNMAFAGKTISTISVHASVVVADVVSVAVVTRAPREA